jgi:hypothetical protein
MLPLNRTCPSKPHFDGPIIPIFNLQREQIKANAFISTPFFSRRWTKKPKARTETISSSEESRDKMILGLDSNLTIIVGKFASSSSPTQMPRKVGMIYHQRDMDLQVGVLFHSLGFLSSIEEIQILLGNFNVIPALRFYFYIQISDAYSRNRHAP